MELLGYTERRDAVQRGDDEGSEIGLAVDAAI
jgi:hypothetical protein